MRIGKLLVLLAVAVSFGSSCVQPNPNPKTTSQQPKVRTTARLIGFSSPDELRSYLATQAEAQINTSQTGGGVAYDLFAPVAATSISAPSAPQSLTGGAETASDSNTSAGASSSDPFSTTNVQEEGVDESDIVKNDGQTIYSLDGDKVHITQATPPDGVNEIATIQLPYTGSSLYLKGTTLVVLTTQYGYYYPGGPLGISGAALPEKTAAAASASSSGGSGSAGSTAPSAPISSDIAIAQPISNQQQTIVILYDVSDPANPALKATAKFDGTLDDSRLINSKLHLVLQTTPILPTNPTPKLIEAQDLSTWIPNFEIDGPDGTALSSGDVVTFDHVFRPDDPDGYSIVTVVTMDVDDPTAPFASTAITADAGTVYASKDALYITDTNYSYALSTSRVDTAIHKLAFTDAGTDYRASGIVPGRLLNQYSLGEFNGNLRIASHIDPAYVIAFEAIAPTPVTADATSGSGNASSGTVTSTGTAAPAIVTTAPQGGNAVYVLSENAADISLDIVGKVENIAPGEEIYAARFVGDRGFLVTFHRIDPLFALDLSDPTNPFVAGELKVPGYSDHIQLLDENHLLTIGKNTQDAGAFAWVQGVQLSLFDVTDLANPTLLSKEQVGGRGSSSEANYNPKAFNYFAAKNALAFPVDVYGAANNGPVIFPHQFTGLYVYRVTVADGFQFLGRIDTDAGFDKSGCFYGYYGYTRGVFIGNDVYSVTQQGVKAADLANVGTLVGQTTFANATALYPDCYLTNPTIVLPEGDGLQ